MAMKILSLSKTSKPNPMAPKDKSIRLHKIFKNTIEGKTDQNIHSTGMKIGGNVSDADSATALMNTFQKSEKKTPNIIKDREGSEESGDPAAAKIPKPRAKGKGKAKGKGAVAHKKGKATIGSETTLAGINSVKMRVRQSIRKLSITPDLLRTDKIVMETLEQLLPKLEVFVGQFEEAELNEADTSGIAALYAASVETGDMLTLREDLEFAEGRLARLSTRE